MSREDTKAAHYIQQLDEARCHGNWDAVPELLRKVKKHAPNRTCLALTVECEHAIHEASLPRAAPPQSTLATRSTSTTETSSPVARFVPSLAQAIKNEKNYVEDSFQAEACLGWLHWSLGDPNSALSTLSQSIEQEYSQLDGTGKQSTGWTKVCALKASYVKGTAQVQTGAVVEALETFESALPILSTNSPSLSQGRELQLWTELFLTGFCMLSSHMFKSKKTPTLETETLSAFRAWTRFWDSQPSSPQSGRVVGADVPRRRVWKEYYLALSTLLQHDLPFPTTPTANVYAETSTRLQQRAELKRVESRYESLLLNEVQFPQAEQASEEVEDFVEVAIANWKVLCGSNWKDDDLGEGGSEAVSRGVLDILYRAATKTFHSTAILRHLFTVHLAIAEFDLALKAFDTYLEIVKKGKARIEKTGVPEHGLDPDNIVLGTVSECVKALCRYGTHQGAEKAKELGAYLEEWIENYQLAKVSHGGTVNDHDSDASTISLQDLSMTWRTIGICHAQSARITYDAPLRGEMQLKAIRCFKKALSPEYHCSADLETLFALGTILAERREINAAIEVIKAGLLPQTNTTIEPSNGQHSHLGRFARERRLLPLWHLMALLLSAKQQFLSAARFCEGAFEQFHEPKNLFGDHDPESSFRSEHLNEKTFTRTLGIVDDMDDFEKEAILELKMTQLALIELLEGPEVAVNASDELLGLYSRLFGHIQKEALLSRNSGAAVLPPQTSSGTVRSIRGSIFGRAGRSLRRTEPTATSLSDINERDGHNRPQTIQTLASTTAPTIQVTSESGLVGQRSASQKEPHRHEKLQKRNDSMSRKRSIKARNRNSSAARSGQNADARSQSGSPQRIGSTVDGGNDSHATRNTNAKDNSSALVDGETAIGIAAAAPTTNYRHSGSSQPLPPNSQQMSHKENSLKPAHNDPSIVQDSRLPRVSAYSSSTGPITRFPQEQQRRRRMATLSNVWLLISRFYRNAGLFGDSKAAVEEAEKLVESLQSETLKDLSAPVSVQNAGWGGGKSVSELWGDINSEYGLLAVSESSPHRALSYFESALINLVDHPSAVVGLSNLLLDIYTGALPPLPSAPTLSEPDSPKITSMPSISSAFAGLSLKSSQSDANKHKPVPSTGSQEPLGLPKSKSTHMPDGPASVLRDSELTSRAVASKEPTTSELDRLAARDRAYGLLTGLTKLGSGWNNSEAWFALARAYEEGGQSDKAREALWWCVELEDGQGVRSWKVVSSGGYVL